MKFPVKFVCEISVVYGFVVIGKAQGIPLKKCLKQLGDHRCEQTPDAEVDKILI